MSGFWLEKMTVGRKVAGESLAPANPIPSPAKKRWLRRVVIALGGIVTLAVIFVFVLLHNLDRPIVKRRVQALVHANAGVDIDYADVRVELMKGLEIRDLVVLSPPSLRDVAPELARVGRIDAHWTSSLFTGRGRRVDAVSISDVALTVAMDENGKTTFDALASPNPAPPSAPTPLSHRASDLLESASALPTIDLTGVSLALVRTEKGKVVERYSLRGAALSVNAETIKGEPHLRVSLGSPESPLDLDVTREHEGAQVGAAKARLSIAADVTSTTLVAAADLAVSKQTFLEGLDTTQLQHVVHAEANARFDRAAGTTTIAIDHTFVADDVATTEAKLVIFDRGSPLVEHAKGDIDFARLLKLIPPSLVPVRASLKSGHAHYEIDKLALDALPKLNEGSSIAIDADLDDVKIALTDRDVDAGKMKLSAHAAPLADSGFGAKASLTIDHARTAAGHDAAMVGDLALDIDATQTKDGALTGNVTLHFGAIDLTGTTALDARRGKIGLRAERLVVDRAAPLSTRGDVTATTDVASLDLHSSMQTSFDGIDLRVHTALTGKAPYAVDADLRAAQFRLDRAGSELMNVPLHVDAKLDDAFPDLQNGAASRGKAHVAVDAGDVHADLDATKGADALDYSIDSKATSLSTVRPFVSPDLAKKIPFARMSVALKSSGHLVGLTSPTPSIEQHSEISLDRPAFDRVASRALSIALDSHGTSIEHAFDVDLHVAALTVDGKDASDDHVKLAGSIDRRAPSLKLDIDTDGRAKIKLAAAFGFDRAQHAVTYDVGGTFAKLSPLDPLLSTVHGLDGIDVSKLDFTLSTKGAATGVVTDVDRDGTIHLASAPQRTAGVVGSIKLDAHNVGYSSGDFAVTTPSISIASDLRAAGAKRTVETRVSTDDVQLAVGPHDFGIAGFSDHSSVIVDGDLTEPSLQLTEDMALHVVKQDVAPLYSIGDATIAIAVRRGRDDVIHVSKLDVTNAAAGTSFSLKGAADLSENQQRLSLHGDLHQNLAKLSNAPDVLAARGIANVSLRVESPDLSVFRTYADVQVQGADVRLPKSGVVVEGADGEVPITETTRINKTGIHLIRADQDNPYSSLRFADQHPLLSRSSFISVHKLTLPQVTITPLAGNLQIEENILSLRQFEMGIRSGRVTGQCALDWNGENSVVDMHVRADGVMSSHNEPFTGSAALVIKAGERSIEGRADILQIGKRHLLDLLDLQDPFHADAAINRVRSAMTFGYPDKLRLTFDHGFASVHVAFGGLARLVSVGDLKGIPMGPIIDQFIAPLLPSQEDE